MLYLQQRLQFSSMSHQLKFKLNINVSHAELRTAVVEFLDHSSFNYSQYVTEPWSVYLERMRTAVTFGDHLTLLATAVLYKVNVFVLP